MKFKKQTYESAIKTIFAVYRIELIFGRYDLHRPRRRMYVMWGEDRK